MNEETDYAVTGYTCSCGEGFSFRLDPVPTSIAFSAKVQCPHCGKVTEVMPSEFAVSLIDEIMERHRLQWWKLLIPLSAGMVVGLIAWVFAR